jgi:hypothetical protein
LAYADDVRAADIWMKGQQGMPCFVVDKTGRIAYIGHAMFLGLVLPKVIAGRTSAKTVSEEMAKVMAEYETVHATLVRDFEAGRDLKAGLRALKEFEARYPPLTDMLPIIRAKLSLLPKHGKPDEAKEYAEALLTKAIKQNDDTILELAYSILRNEKDKRLLALAKKGAEAHVRIDGGKGAQSLLNLAEAYFVDGDKLRARDYAQQAIAAAAGESAAFREYVEKEARRLGAEKAGSVSH